MKVTQTHAGICFVILSSFTLLYGLGLLALCLFLRSVPPLLLSRALIVSAPFFVSGICAWAAWSLLRSVPRAGLIATIAWVLVAIVTVACLMDIIEAGRDPLYIIGLGLLLVTEFLIGVHLIQRRHDVAT
jgi:hypothetical protein